MDSLLIKFLIPPDSLSDALTVREEVFQKEQGIAQDLDFDGKDNTATHIVVYKNGKPVGTGRLRRISDSTIKIERVAVLAEARGQGIGKLIMQKIDAYISKGQVKKVVLDAQYHAKGFYENLGYRQEGQTFEEVGIPHVVMSKRFI